jgi:hypothetical protein
VSPPVPGTIYQTVPARRVLTRHAVPLKSPAHFNSAVTAKLTAVRSIIATAHGPGEISGPALEIGIRITNAGKRSIDLSNVVVNLTDATGVPGLRIAGEPAAPFRGALASGRSASGTYVFTVPVGKRSPISVTVSYTALAPVVLFVGNAS